MPLHFQQSQEFVDSSTAFVSDSFRFAADSEELQSCVYDTLQSVALQAGISITRPAAKKHKGLSVQHGTQRAHPSHCTLHAVIMPAPLHTPLTLAASFGAGLVASGCLGLGCLIRSPLVSLDRTMALSWATGQCHSTMAMSWATAEYHSTVKANTPATSAPGLGSRYHICTGTRRIPVMVGRQVPLTCHHNCATFFRTIA
jgi:hypothetical protein